MIPYGVFFNGSTITDSSGNLTIYGNSNLQNGVWVQGAATLALVNGGWGTLELTGSSTSARGIMFNTGAIFLPPAPLRFREPHPEPYRKPMDCLSAATIRSRFRAAPRPFLASRLGEMAFTSWATSRLPTRPRARLRFRGPAPAISGSRSARMFPVPALCCCLERAQVFTDWTLPAETQFPRLRRT